MKYWLNAFWSEDYDRPDLSYVVAESFNNIQDARNDVMENDGWKGLSYIATYWRDGPNSGETNLLENDE